MRNSRISHKRDKENWRIIGLIERHFPGTEVLADGKDRARIRSDRTNNVPLFESDDGRREMDKES